MLRIFTSAFLLFVSFFAMHMDSYGAEANSGTTIASTGAELSVKTVKVLDSITLRVSFSESIDLTSVVLKVTKQSDSSTISISDIKTVQDISEDIDVIVKDEFEEGSSYTLTVLAAVGVGGSTIIDGAGALREFVTPSPLKKAVPTFNAPANPTAVSVESNTASTIKENPKEPPVEEVPEVVEEVPVPTEELPLTGMNPFIFVIFALPLAYIFLRKKSS